MYLEEEDDGVLVLAASVTLQETNKTLCNGYATLTIGDCAIETVKIHPSEIQTVVELIRKYQQPDPDFDPELESWERAAKQLTLVGWC